MLDWPLKSPDLSPIVNLWDYLKDSIGSMYFEKEKELFDKLKYEWEGIPQDVLHHS